MASAADIDLVLKLAERAKPVLAGQSPEIQGAVLAELLSLWLAGHTPEAREAILQMHVEQVRLLAIVNAREIRGEGEPRQ